MKKLGVSIVALLIAVGGLLLSGVDLSLQGRTLIDKLSGLKNPCIDEEPEAAIHLNGTLVNEDIEELAGLDRKIRKYMTDWQIEGLSLSVSRGDSLLYVKGYGMADDNEPMSPSHIMRVASVSKLITAVGIMKLCDEGRLSLDDKVFGQDGILSDSLYCKYIGSRKGDYEKITVEHLLRHQGGFMRDPMFGIKDLMDELCLESPATEGTIAKLALSSRLRWEPGTWQRYSNVGYLFLGQIIAKVSGKDYEEYLRDDVLAPAGCFDMHIGGTYYEDKLPGEVRYHAHLGDGHYIPDWRNPADSVERCYGGNDIKLLGAAGGWVASPAELSRLVASIDKDPLVPDILSPEAVDRMVEYFDENTFSLGWVDTKPESGWKRSGSYSGTHALIMRYPDGECWIIVCNTSTYRGPNQTKNALALFDSCRALYSAKLPKRNLFF